MIYITQHNDCGVVYGKRQPPTGTPENTDRTYIVSGREVRCVRRAGGKVVDTQLVAVLASEQEAEATARELADPQYAGKRGRRALEELIEEDS